MRRFAVGIIVALGALTASVSRAEKVELILRGPDGKPAERVAVEVKAQDRGSGREQPPSAKATTDQQGHASFEWPAGVWRMEVRVPRVGHTGTGIVEILPNVNNTLKPPPLAPFGHIEGMVPADAANGIVKVSGIRGFAEPLAITPVDRRFSAEIPAGQYFLFVSDGRKRLADAGRISVAPGQVVRGVGFKPVPADQQVYPGIRQERPGADATLTWVRGTVRDEAGAPLRGAAVYACATYHGGIRMSEILSKSVTDDQGRYEIQGPGGLSSFSATLVAHVPGRPPAWSWFGRSDFDGGWIEVGTTRPAKKPDEPPIRDLIIPSRAGTLDVAVLRDGRPAAGAWVKLALEGVNLRDIWARGSGGDTRDALLNIVEPTGQSDPNGVVTFRHLLPGQYRITATSGQKSDVQGAHSPWGDESGNARGTAFGVNVRTGQTTAHQMNIYVEPLRAKLQVRDDVGEALVGQSLSFDYGRIAGGGWSSSITLNAAGEAEHGFDAAGLWQLQVKYRRSPTAWIPYREPFSAASAVVAISSLLDSREPVRLQSRRFEPGSIIASIHDSDGKPLRGFVDLGYYLGDRISIGSTDDAGVIRFTGAPKWKCTLRAHVPDLTPPDIIAPGDMPPEQSLTNRRAIFAESITPQHNTEHRVTLKVQPVGYILGAVKPAADKKPSQYTVYFDQDITERGTEIRYDPTTGQFVAGPLPAGPCKLVAWDQSDVRRPGKCAEVTAQITAGRVTRVELPAMDPPVRPLSGQGSMLIGIGGASALGTGAEQLVGRVILPDGKTPALAARVMYFEPYQWEARLAGMSDAAGRLHPRGVWHSANAGDAPPPAYPDRPVTVAWLPGNHGAVIVPLDQAKQAAWTLPESRMLRGIVTVGGKAPPPRGQIRLVAAFQGKGALEGLLSVQATAQADGAFELGGLTPGAYRVQAALDDIWLSPTVEVNVDQGDPPPLRLAIGAPGGPVRVKLVDPQRRPLAGRAVTLNRPPGPLGVLWPEALESDGAGQVWIPSLEAGVHKLRVVGTSVERDITANPLPAERVSELTIEVGP